MNNTVSGTANIDGLELIYSALQRRDGLWEVTMTSDDGITSRLASQVWPGLASLAQLALNHRKASLEQGMIP